MMYFDKLMVIISLI